MITYSESELRHLDPPNVLLELQTDLHVPQDEPIQGSTGHHEPVHSPVRSEAVQIRQAFERGNT